MRVRLPLRRLDCGLRGELGLNFGIQLSLCNGFLFSQRSIALYVESRPAQVGLCPGKLCLRAIKLQPGKAGDLSRTEPGLC